MKIVHNSLMLIGIMLSRLLGESNPRERKDQHKATTTIGLLLLLSLGWSLGARADEGRGQHAKGGNACIKGASNAALIFESNRVPTGGNNLLCDEANTDFFKFWIYSSQPRNPRGLPYLFWQRTPGHLTEAEEGREPRLSYLFRPHSVANLWAITVTDARGNKREGQDYLWARDLRDAIDGNASVELILGEPIVYISCNRFQEQTCSATYNIDKCYAAEGYPAGTSGQNRASFHLSATAYGRENVKKLLAGFEQVNLLAEELLRIITPSACAYEERPNEDRN